MKVATRGNFQQEVPSRTCAPRTAGSEMNPRAVGRDHISIQFGPGRAGVAVVPVEDPTAEAPRFLLFQ